MSGFLLSLDLDKKEKSVEVIRTIPEIKLTLNDVTLDEINDGPKSTKYIGNRMTLIDGDDEYDFDNVEIRGRGNASWLMDKKSYRLKLSQRVDLLGLGKLKKWGLISNNIDDTLMRNDLGHYIASFLYDSYPIRGEFVNLKIDDDDLGLYYMVNLVDIGKNMIDLKNSDGILIEIDNAYCDSEKGYKFTKIASDCISIKDIVDEDNVDEILNAFMNDYNEFELLIRGGDYEMVAEKVDIESFAEYYILSEITSNPDAYVTSWYLYRDGEEDRIQSGIGWDFDAAFGNRNWGSREGEFYSPTGLMVRMRYLVDGWDNYNDTKRCELLKETLISPTMCYMINMPEFRDLVGRIYRERLIGKRMDIISYIRNTADYIRDEAVVDNELWSKGDFDDEINYLVWWVDKRFDYLDELFGGGWPEPVEL